MPEALASVALGGSGIRPVIYHFQAYTQYIQAVFQASLFFLFYFNRKDYKGLFLAFTRQNKPSRFTNYLDSVIFLAFSFKILKSITSFFYGYTVYYQFISYCRLFSFLDFWPVCLHYWLPLVLYFQKLIYSIGFCCGNYYIIAFRNLYPGHYFAVKCFIKLVSYSLSINSCNCMHVFSCENYFVNSLQFLFRLLFLRSIYSCSGYSRTSCGLCVGLFSR